MIYAPLPGEYVASAMKRGNEIIGMKSLKRTDYLIKKSPMKMGERNEKIQFPNLFNEHDVTNEILYKNSIYPLAAALGRNRASTIYTPQRSWKVCLRCVIEDVTHYGTAYIHCRNLLRSVISCSIHGCKLYERCPTCLTKITSHNIAGLARCSILFPKPQSDIGSICHQYSEFISDLINYNSIPFLYNQVESVLLLNLEIMGIMKEQNTEKWLDHINTKLKINLKIHTLKSLSIDVCATTAFEIFQTSDEYLTAMNDSSYFDYLIAQLPRRHYLRRR